MVRFYRRYLKQMNISFWILTKKIVFILARTEFASGTWVGVELDTHQGKNDGAVKGIISTRHYVFLLYLTNKYYIGLIATFERTTADIFLNCGFDNF